MSWRIKSLILYQRDGNDKRVLKFNTHGVNVITGNSQTGKSAVLDILNYVLMSKSCPIPKGIIRQAVSHVGGHFIGPDSELMILRPLPDPGSKVSTQGWYQLGKRLTFPNELPDMVSNREVIRDVLSSFTGISGAAVLSNPKEPWQAVQAEANIRHAAPLIFQPQDIVANRYVSVPGLDLENHRRHMLDALPFLLGIENAEFLSDRARLRHLKGKIRVLKMRGQERQRLRANTFARGHKLWLEAQGVGLIDGKIPESVPELLVMLRDLHVDNEKRFNIATVVPDIRELEARELDTRKAVQNQRKRIKSLLDFEQAAESHQDVVARQINKLSVADLLPTAYAGENCPVCNSNTFASENHREQLKMTLSSLENIRAVPLKIDVKARKARIRLEEDLVPLEEAHESARAKLRNAVAVISKNAKWLAGDRAIDRLLGRVAEYLRTVDIGDMDDEDAGLAGLISEADELLKKINSIWKRRMETQKKIDTRMTSWARRMEVEFKEGNASISVEDLAIKVQVDPNSDEMTSLSEIGSGANWVCYHLAGILAIHDHLSKNDCPVPRTLLIDQPSQAWFPEELKDTDKEGNLIPRRSEDANRVRDIYQLLSEISAQNKFSQIIVMDHARFADKWFMDLVRYEWRHGNKLVPEHWIL
jgi:hypothetical protein